MFVCVFYAFLLVVVCSFFPLIIPGIHACVKGALFVYLLFTFRLQTSRIHNHFAPREQSEDILGYCLQNGLLS